MKKTLPLFIWFFFMAACHSGNKPVAQAAVKDTIIAAIDSAIIDTSKLPKEDFIEKEYSEEEVAKLTAFLDSIGKLDLTNYGKKILRRADSVFHVVRQMNKTLSEADFKKLKLCADKGRIDKHFAKRIFQFIHDSDLIPAADYNDSTVELNVYSFDSTQSDYNEFALSVGYGGLKWAEEIYFFKKNKIIAWQNIYHRYGLELKSFRDADNRTVIYYQENFGSGTGVYQSNYFFYKYFDARLRPVLNTICSSIDWGSECRRRMETRIISKSPLLIKYNYEITLYKPFCKTLAYNEFADNNFLKDSAIIKFKWDSISQTFKGDFSGNFKEREVACYYLEGCYSNSYTYNYYYPKLKAILNGPQGKDRNSILAWLACLQSK